MLRSSSSFILFVNTYKMILYINGEFFYTTLQLKL